MEKIKVLFVDDEVLAMEYLQSIISWEELGFYVVGHARSGKKALEIYEREKPQIVISDIKMSGMDGLELAQILKEKDNDIEIILLSAYKDFEYAQKGLEYGVSNYLLKHELCEEKLVKEMAKVRSKLENNKHKKRIYQKYFIEQLIYNAENMDIADVEELGNRFFMVLVHKNEEFVGGRFEKNDWTAEELKLLEESISEDLEDVTYVTDIQLTGNNILVLYRLGNINSRYQVNIKIEQKSRMIAASMTAIAGCQFNIVFSDEIHRDEISSTFQKVSGQIRHAVFWKNRCIYGMNRLKDICEEERIAWNDHEKELRKLIQKGGEEYADFVRYLFELVKFPEYNLSALRELLFMLENLVREFENRESIFWENTGKPVIKIDDICHGYIERIKFIIETVEQRQLNQYSRLVCEMITYIRKNYELEINLDMLGEEFNMNGVYLGQIFKKETGVTFLKYLTNIRVEEAKRLLLQGDLNIAQVAEKVGYKTSQYFSQIFIKTVGIKPQEYRKWSGKRAENDI